MLTSRKDAGSGNKLALYWDDGRGKKLVPLDKHEEYWGKEVARVNLELKKAKAETKYAEAQEQQAQQKIDDLILDRDLMQAMLDLRDLQLKKALRD